MSQDQDPIDATRPFEPVDPYNIPGYQQPEEQHYGTPQPPRAQGFKQRLTRLGPLKLAVLGTAGVIVLGGAAWVTTAALRSGGSSSSNTAASAPVTDQSQSASQPAGAGATTGGTGRRGRVQRLARVTITQVGAGTFTGTDGQGRTVTVDYDDKTRFGTKANPLTSAGLQAGMTVAVAGPRQGDTITALDVVVPARLSKTPEKPGDSANPTDPASPVGGAA